jgi:hypothetical protein
MLMQFFFPLNIPMLMVQRQQEIQSHSTNYRYDKHIQPNSYAYSRSTPYSSSSGLTMRCTCAAIAIDNTGAEKTHTRNDICNYP